ncbi:LutC/YkgG family protein [Alteribacillus iranensis]|uniref:L-lactate dehydrogenase complex protein LldG n=1 Tax=Alteribacillus iranensis TaxID=930128 RepID=A0A1I2DNR8_9BACI|nr:lactate utilization protein C [Alteribacillus iranensis]SFE82117.1 L-lactate dehydrogenase complex protein LldG [Alteribacillus iranensis]
MSSGNVQNQTTFLNHVADRLGRERRTTVNPPSYFSFPHQKMGKEADISELAKVLKKQCLAIHTDVREATINNLREVIDQVFVEYEAITAAVWDDPRFHQFGLDSIVERPQVSVWGEEPGREANIQAAEQADVGITFSDYTLAESGTVVIMNGAGKGLSVSLLPTNYIAIIPLSTLVPRMTQATAAIHEQAEKGRRLPACINFISGPSNSADIELDLVVGVHGPVRACYILVDDLKKEKKNEHETN